MALGITAPIIVVTIGWRFIYFLTSGVAVFAWLMLVFFAPESRWMRSPAELGKHSYS
jgi:hypothetical protein